MPARRLKEFLDSHQVRYTSIAHSPAYTAQEIAALVHIPGQELAKTVIVELDGKTVMVVLPTSYRVDFDHLKQVTGAKRVELVREKAFKGLFPGCEVGAMPPFGNLYGVDVYVAEELAADEEITFNAGSHTELIRLSYQDFEHLVKPKILRSVLRAHPN